MYFMPSLYYLDVYGANAEKSFMKMTPVVTGPILAKIARHAAKILFLQTLVKKHSF
jgi:hypothetical protein